MNNLDKQFSTGLQNLQIQPKAGGFEAVLKQVNRRRKTRIILILSASLILVISSVSILIQTSFYKNNTSSITQKSNNTESNLIENNITANVGRQSQDEVADIQTNENKSTEIDRVSKSSKSVNTSSLPSIKKSKFFANRKSNIKKEVPNIAVKSASGTISDGSVLLDEWFEIALKSRLNLFPFPNAFDLDNDITSVRKFEPYKQKGTIYIDYLIAPEYVNKVLNLKAGDNNGLADARNKTEKYRFAYGGTIRLTVPVKDGWYVQSGFGYHKFTEFFNYESEHLLQSMKLDTTIRVIHVPGEPDKFEQHIDTSYTSIKISNQSRNVNSFSQIVVPIGGGYRWIRGNMNIGLNGGVQLMLISRAKGNIVNTTNDGISNASQNVYKTGLNLGFYAGGTFEYGILPKIMLLCEPYFKTNLGGLTTNQYQLSQRNIVFGLNTGIRFKLR